MATLRNIGDERQTVEKAGEDRKAEPDHKQEKAHVDEKENNVGTILAVTRHVVGGKERWQLRPKGVETIVVTPGMPARLELIFVSRKDEILPIDEVLEGHTLKVCVYSSDSHEIECIDRERWNKMQRTQTPRSNSDSTLLLDVRTPSVPSQYPCLMVCWHSSGIMYFIQVQSSSGMGMSVHKPRWLK